jgi:feruloyl esterase
MTSKRQSAKNQDTDMKGKHLAHGGRGRRRHAPGTSIARPAAAFGLALFAGVALLSRGQAAAQTSCQSMAGAVVPNTQITTAQTVNAGPFTPPDGTAPVTLTVSVCRIVAVVSTQPGEQVGIEVWLPLAGWNGRFQGLGSGGFGGSIDYPSLALSSGGEYAAANTDTGHTGGTIGSIGQPLPWAQNPVTLRDWGHTSIHLMTDSARTITKLFYGKDAAYRYYEGCSTGGAEAMEEAEFYPDDYNGIHAGSPGMDYSHLMESFLWGGLLPAKNSAATLDTAALTLLNNAVLQACGGSAALTAGYLLDPRECNFQPNQLKCQGGQAAGTCLAAPQVTEAERLYSPVRNPRTLLELYPGFARGSESQWSLIQGALVPYFAQPLLANTVFNNPNWNWTTFDFDKDAALVDRVLSPVINATNPDLSRFQAQGGKLLMTQGWADALNAQTLPIEYFNNVLITEDSLDRVLNFYRLFMAPGMSHCGGGPGPNTIGGSVPPVALTRERDTTEALRAWVEHGIAPDYLISTKYLNDTPPAIEREIRLCPYPMVTRYLDGDPTRADNYTCGQDREAFKADVELEARHVTVDLTTGNIANLPN